MLSQGQGAQSRPRGQELRARPVSGAAEGNIPLPGAWRLQFCPSPSQRGDEFEQCRCCCLPQGAQHTTHHHGCPLLSRRTPSSPAAALLGTVAGRASHGALSSSGLPAAEEPKCSCSLAEETRADSISVREKSFSPLLGSSETEIIHWVLAPTSPVIQRLTLPCIFSSITLFSGCYNLAAYMFVLLN